MNLKKYRFLPDRQTGFISDENAKIYFSRIGISVFVFGVAATLVNTLLYMLVSSFLPSITSNGAVIAAVNHTVSFVSIYAIAMPIFCYLLKPLPTMRPFRKKMGVKDIFGGFCVSLLFMMVGNYISNIVIVWLQTMLKTTTQNPVEEAISPSDPWTIVVTVIFMVIVGPILEELLFRKILCDKLMALGEGYAILLSAAIFGLFHGNFYQFAYAFLLGAVFSLIYVKTGKLIYSTVYHMVINLLGAVIGPWILEQIDLDKLYALMESGVVDPADPIWQPMFLLMIYESLMTAAAVVGLVLVFKARKKGTLTLERGILPPPRQHRIANLFCNVGVAAAITYFVFTFVVSLL